MARSLEILHNIAKISGALASGSAQYSQTQIQNMISSGAVQQPLTVVDLRQESHGFLTVAEAVNGETEIAISWFAERDWINVAKSLVGIESDESSRLSGAAQSPSVTVSSVVTKTPDEDGICTATPSLVFPTGSYTTEQALLQARNMGLRLPTSDHCRPRDSEVAISSASKRRWIRRSGYIFAAAPATGGRPRSSRCTTLFTTPRMTR